MSQTDTSVLAAMVDKLQRWRPLSEADREALLALPFRLIELASAGIYRAGGRRPQSSCIMLSGFSFRHKVAGNGGRQIFSIHMRATSPTCRIRCSAPRITICRRSPMSRSALIPVEAVQELAFARPAIGLAMWYETLVDVLDLPRMDAQCRSARRPRPYRAPALRVGAAAGGRRARRPLRLRGPDDPGAAGRCARTHPRSHQPDIDEPGRGRTCQPGSSARCRSSTGPA